jgi:hypothetical protein
MSLSGMNDPQVFAWFKAFMNLGQIVPHSTSTTSDGTPIIKGLGPSTEIYSPITSLTPLQTIFGNTNFELTLIGDLTHILPEEMPPSDLFFQQETKGYREKIISPQGWNNE